MLLLTLNEWLGPGRKMSSEERSSWEVQEKIIAIATRLKLGEAIGRVNKHQEAYNDFYPLAVNFRLLQVAEIEDLTDEQLGMVAVELAENLKQSPEEFEE